MNPIPKVWGLGTILKHIGQCVYWKCTEEYEEHIRVMLQRLWGHQLYAKFSKCEFWISKVSFLGHMIPPEGIVLDPGKFDYVLTHTRFMGSCKLTSFNGHWVGQYTSPLLMYTGIVYGPPTDSPECGIAWKTCTSERWDPSQLFDCCHELWPLVESSWLTCVVL
jgi:hypothetical protein